MVSWMHGNDRRFSAALGEVGRYAGKEASRADGQYTASCMLLLLLLLLLLVPV